MESETKRPPFADHMTSVETIGGAPVRYSLQFTVEANDAGHALLADIDAALKRAQSPAPAWTREAPKAPGWFWTRFGEPSEPIDEWGVETNYWDPAEDAFFSCGETMTLADARGRFPGLQFWSVPIPEPPK